MQNSETTIPWKLIPIKLKEHRPVARQIIEYHTPLRELPKWKLIKIDIESGKQTYSYPPPKESKKDPRIQFCKLYGEVKREAKIRRLFGPEN